MIQPVARIDSRDGSSGASRSLRPAELARVAGLYLALFMLPGGSLLALVAWWYRRRA